MFIHFARLRREECPSTDSSTVSPNTFRDFLLAKCEHLITLSPFIHSHFSPFIHSLCDKCVCSSSSSLGYVGVNSDRSSLLMFILFYNNSNHIYRLYELCSSTLLDLLIKGSEQHYKVCVCACVCVCTLLITYYGGIVIHLHMYVNINELTN